VQCRRGARYGLSGPKLHFREAKHGNQQPSVLSSDQSNNPPGFVLKIFVSETFFQP